MTMVAHQALPDTTLQDEETSGAPPVDLDRALPGLASELARLSTTPDNDPANRLFLVVDTARDPDLFDFLAANEHRMTLRCLYKGEAAVDLADVAPYLVQLDAVAGPSQELLRRWWGRAALIVLAGPVDFDDLRLHLRKLTYALLPSGEAVLFRFYDPRVARSVVKILDRHQLHKFFGPVRSLVAEAETPGQAICYTFNASGQEETARDGSIQEGSILKEDTFAA